MPEYKYPKLLTVDTTFFNGESPSPTKFNGIFKYINMAFNSLEIFLGNGIDYAPTVLEAIGENKTILNLSSAIGRTGGNIYNALNILPTLENIYKSFGSSSYNTGSTSYLTDEHCTYNADGTLSINTGKTINIPISRSFKCKILIGISYWYNINGTTPKHPIFKIMKVSSTQTNPDESDYIIEAVQSDISEITLIRETPSGNNIITPAHKSWEIPANTFISHISITASTDYPLIITSLYMIKLEDEASTENKVVNYTKKITGTSSVDVVSYSVPFNNMYCIGYENVYWTSSGVKSKSYCTVKKPCSHATGGCTVKTGDNCIGNTYDIYVKDASSTLLQYKAGKPVCAGTIKAVGGSVVHASLQPKDTNGTDIAYEENAVSTTKTIQAPLLIRDIPHTVRYSPIAFITGPASATLEPGRVALYDTQAITSPMKHSMEYNILLKSTARPDILVIEDSKDVIANNTSDRYFIVGGTFGLSDALDRAIETQSTLPNRSVAVYTD